MNNFTEIEQLECINPSDKVYQADDGTVIKVRVLKRKLPEGAPAEAQRNCLAVKVSGSLCDKDGKALTDEETGYLVAPESVHTLHIGSLMEAEKSGAPNLVERIEQLRIDMCEQMLAYQAVLSARSELVLESE